MGWGGTFLKHLGPLGVNTVPGEAKCGEPNFVTQVLQAYTYHVTYLY